MIGGIRIDGSLRSVGDSLYSPLRKRTRKVQDEEQKSLKPMQDIGWTVEVAIGRYQRICDHDAQLPLADAFESSFYLFVNLTHNLFRLLLFFHVFMKPPIT